MKKIQDELAKKYHVANDNAFKHKTDSGPNVSNPLYHRLDDLAHHPTPLGLVASILVRYFRLVIFVDGTDGKPHIFFADASENPAVRKLETEQLIKAWIGAILSGLFMWLANVAEKQYEEKYPKLFKVFFENFFFNAGGPFPHQCFSISLPPRFSLESGCKITALQHICQMFPPTFLYFFAKFLLSR